MHIKEFFYFQKSDRVVVVFLLAVVLVCVVLLNFVGSRMSKTPFAVADSVMQQSEKASYAQRRQQYDNHRAYPHRYYQVEGRTAELFPFDPNTADSTQLLRLGLHPWQVRNIYKYRARGGVYRRPSDFARLFGLTVKQYKELEPYIQISSDYQPASTLVEEYQPYERDTVKYPVKLKPSEHIVLNTADTSALKKVPGIGSGWARAIVGYGERLGGYCRVEQLLEIDGFPDEALPYFVIVNPQTRKIKVNELTVNQLKRHPYLNFYQARAICDYRRLKGSLHDLDQLRLLKEFPPETVERLKPYVEF